MTAVLSRPQSALHHARFVRMIPQIERFANFYFRLEPRTAREDLVAEVVATAYVSFARLVERDKLDVVFPTPLARFSCRVVRVGRRVGNRNDVHDLLSDRAKKAGAVVQGLLELDEKGKWQDLVVEDRKCRPADVAVCRVDFKNWLATLTLRNRRVAETLAAGSTTTETAMRFQISPGRVSQLRQELFEQWQQFHGEVSAEAV